MNDAKTEYADIIGLPRHVSEKHPPMPRLNRAAQFAPYAALTGYDDLIRESERETDARVELDSDGVETLDRKLAWLLRRADPPEAVFTCFVPDAKKDGGAYVRVAGVPVKYDPLSRSVALAGGGTVFIDDVREIECAAFDGGAVPDGPDPEP